MANNDATDNSVKLKYEDRLTEKDNEIQTMQKEIA